MDRISILSVLALFSNFAYTADDQDEDGVEDAFDNYPLKANGDQTDTDGDGQGDAYDLLFCYIVDHSNPDDCLNPDAPLTVRAGPEIHGGEGEAVRLRILANRVNAPFDYAWSITRSPEDSEATPMHPTGTVSVSTAAPLVLPFNRRELLSTSDSPPFSFCDKIDHMKSEAARAKKILSILKKTYRRTPDAFVRWNNPLELTIATVLSAQCTDKKVNEVTTKLFKKYRTAKDYARARLPTLEKEIHPTGFYKSKAKYLKGIGTLLVKNFGGTVPKTRDELITLPGVSYKSANLIMAKAWGVPTGVAVDTHVNRVAPRLGLTHEKSSTEKKAADLEKLFPKKDWLDVNEYFILHGRATCVAQKPKCFDCPLQKLCPSAEKYIKMYWKK